MTTSQEWRQYFARNARNLLAIPWSAGVALSPDERRAIAASVQEFQAGEGSDGRHFVRFAQAYAARSGDHGYVAALRLFIAEEQRHARDLGRFLRLAGLPLLETTFGDRVFRGLRHALGSLESTIMVLLTAELLAKVYYAALREATGSVILRRLCDQILQDEVRHVQFQAGQLAKMRAGRSRWLLTLVSACQRILMAGALLAILPRHHPVLRRGGWNFGRYWRGCWQEFNAAFGPAAQNSLDLPDCSPPVAPAVEFAAVSIAHAPSHRDETA